MRILVVLWTVSLVGLCHGGGDSKVNSSLFDLEEAEEDAVKVLKLTVKNGGTTKKVQYNGQKVWSAMAVFGSPCSSAVLYFDGEQPTLAVIKTKGTIMGESTVYKYYDGKKWKDGNEDNHKRKLEELKEDYKPTDPSDEDIPVTYDPNTLNLVSPDPSLCTSLEGSYLGSPAKYHIVNPGSTVTKVIHDKEEVWIAGEGERCLYCIEFLSCGNKHVVNIGIKKANGVSVLYYEYNSSGKTWNAVTNGYAKIKSLKTSSTKLQKQYIYVTSLEDSNSHKVALHERDGITARLYSMTPEYMVEKVIYDTSTLWELKDKGKACFFCEVYAKGNTEIVKLYIDEDYRLSSLYLEKKDDKWESINETDFYDKLAGISTDTPPTCAPENTENSTSEAKAVSNQETGHTEGNLAKEYEVSSHLEPYGEKIEEVYDAPYEQSETNELSTELSQVSLNHSNISPARELVQLAGTGVVIIDLANLDEEKLEIVKASKNGVKHIQLTPKGCFSITSVVYSGVPVWTATGDEKCTFIGSFEMEDYVLIAILVNGDNNNQSKYFEKVNGTWKEITEDGFNQKVKAMGSKKESPESHSHPIDEVHERTVENPVSEEVDSETPKVVSVETESNIAIQEDENADNPEEESSETPVDGLSVENIEDLPPQTFPMEHHEDLGYLDKYLSGTTTVDVKPEEVVAQDNDENQRELEDNIPETPEESTENTGQEDAKVKDHMEDEPLEEVKLTEVLEQSIPTHTEIPRENIVKITSDTATEETSTTAQFPTPVTESS